MNEQQKKAVEEALNLYRKESLNINPDIEGAYEIGFGEGLVEVINTPSKYGLQPVNQWISIKEQLPSVGEEFNLIQDIQDGLGDPVSTCGEWNAIKKYFEYIGTDVEISNVTHWQPLPPQPDVEPK